TEATASTGGFVVQLSSQKSEAEALASFRSLQAKFPNELGDRQPVIRRADLGKKGVFYRTAVGPFASAHEASQFCANYKAAGAQCVVPKESYPLAPSAPRGLTRADDGTRLHLQHCGHEPHARRARLLA